jgi:hypothetical protein
LGDARCRGHAPFDSPPYAKLPNAALPPLRPYPAVGPWLATSLQNSNILGKFDHPDYCPRAFEMSHEQDGRWAMSRTSSMVSMAMLGHVGPCSRRRPLPFGLVHSVCLARERQALREKRRNFPLAGSQAAGPALVCLLSALWRMSPQTSLLSLLANTAATRYSSQTAGATQSSQLEAC